ncbi:hypothetical protein [Gordonia humi]|uniref:Uncharacterized protein n=1 Tax=Gordonia humi TaxID=686429 RepID=A0A840F3L5_9ACTN|nr:hypothetical protein [Gordonia humi]MBB4137234.1 hypothetical protein [Gordonia humi]
MTRALESTRTGNVIRVEFEDGRVAELPCHAALIGNPIARQISGWAVYRRQEPWRLLDAGEHAAELREMLAAMPEADRFLSIGPGWYALTAQCWRQLKKIDPECVVGEVKSKFGELRISACDQDGQPVARFGGPIGWARKQSLRTCEWCAGRIPAVHRGDGQRRLCRPCRDFAEAWALAREGRIRISAPTMRELNPRMQKLLSEGWSMVRMDKPIAEGPGRAVSAWFERQSREGR